MCGHEVEFEARPKKKEVPTHCRDCKVRLEIKESTPNQLARKKRRLAEKRIAYYFARSLFCPKCYKYFADERFKRFE
jgi:hypothetical protein